MKKPAPAPRAAETPKPLWLFLTEPGLSGLLTKELKFCDFILPKAKPLVLYLRNYDLLVLPQSQIKNDKARPRLALHVLKCPFFGRSKISTGQLEGLAQQWKAQHCDGLVSSVAGDRFDRRDLNRWLDSQMGKRGLKSVENPTRPVWLMVVDDKYYFGFPHYNHHQITSRFKGEDRHGSLPEVFAAAMVFASVPGESEVVWDPFLGTGTLLKEAAAQMKAPVLIGSDVDEKVLLQAKINLQGIKNLSLHKSDSGVLALGRNDVSLTLANPPYGKQFKVEEGTEALYAAVLRNTLAQASPKWRGVWVTSDMEAFAKAVRGIRGLRIASTTNVKIRGQAAAIFVISKIAA